MYHPFLIDLVFELSIARSVLHSHNRSPNRLALGAHLSFVTLQ